RTLKPGGLFLATFPIRKHQVEACKPRVYKQDDGSLVFLEKPEYHGNPINGEGALVTYDYGYNIHSAISYWADFDVEISRFSNSTYGILGEYTEVIACIKRHQSFSFRGSVVSGSKTTNWLYQIYKFRLPSSHLQSLRLDPTDANGYILIKSLVIEDKYGKIVKSIDLTRIDGIRANSMCHVLGYSDEGLKILSLGNDPHITFSDTDGINLTDIAQPSLKAEMYVEAGSCCQVFWNIGAGFCRENMISLPVVN
ncbi:hypothetical protein V6O07_01515, partial [Arthrospira platensis SPKY2]